MDKKCAICGKTHDLFILEIEYEPGETYAKYLCGSCWDVIAEVAKRATKPMIEASEKNMMQTIGSYVSLE